MIRFEKVSFEEYKRAFVENFGQTYKIEDDVLKKIYDNIKNTCTIF